MLRILFVVAAFMSIFVILFGSMYVPAILNAADPVFCPAENERLIADPRVGNAPRRVGNPTSGNGTALYAHYYCENDSTNQRVEVTGWVTVASIAIGLVLMYVVLRFPAYPKPRDPNLPEIVMP